MAFLMLFSSLGFAFVEHQCMMRGKSVKVVSQIQHTGKEKKSSSCCAKSKSVKAEKGTFFKKAGCCKDNQKTENVQLVSAQSTNLAKFLKLSSGDLLFVQQVFSFLQAEWRARSFVPAGFAHSFSSALHGRSMLIFVQSFLI